MRRRSSVLLIAALVLAAPARAQDDPLNQLPDSVAERIVEFYNAGSTIRLSGESLVAQGTQITGNVAVLGGPFVVQGTIDGDVVVINGDLRLEPGARITGDVTVVGGVVQDGASEVSGVITAFREPLRFRQDANALVYAPRTIDTELSAGREFAFGRTDFLIASRGGYNRVEGLPVAIGPRIRIGRSNPTLVEGLAIYRSSSGLRIEPDEIGYLVRGEQFMGGGRTARVGLTLHSDITPVEELGISDRENSLSTFVLHEDHRDAYEREGWSAYLRFARAGWPHDVTFEYRSERHRSVMTASPWSLFDNDEAWRPEPLISEGTLRSIFARVVHDTRNEVADPATGWFITADLEQGLGGRLRTPAFATIDPVGDTIVTTTETDVREKFTAATLDIRRYARLGPGSRLALRAFAAGSVDGSALPAQRQHTLGGEGTLPGYGLFEFDCGARRRTVMDPLDISDGPPPVVPGDPPSSFPYYGCDRVALVQLEYQASLPFLERISLDSDLGLEYPVRWIVFFDAGRAWNEPDALSGRGGGASDFSADAGIGLRIGGIGAYWAVPLSSGGHGINFFIRLGRRL